MIPTFEEFISTINLFESDEPYQYGIDHYFKFKEASRQIISSILYEDENKLIEWCNVLKSQCHGYQYETEMDHIVNFIVLEYRRQNKEVKATRVAKILYREWATALSFYVDEY
jgi:hypothetical protein